MNKADGGNRRFILVEIEPEICQTVTAQRLKRVIKRYNDLPALGGGFRYCRLGPTIFDETGSIRAGVTFGELAAHVYPVVAYRLVAEVARLREDWPQVEVPVGFLNFT